METVEGQTAYAEMLASKARQVARRRKFAGGVALLAFTFGGVLLAGHVMTLGGGAMVVGIVALLLCLAGSKWSEEDYYSIPGSRDLDGEHRCIHCGHRGIFRRGVYKSNEKFADCSKCKTNLWRYSE